MPLLNKFDIDRPGRTLTKLKESYAKATTAKRRASLIRRHAVVEKRVYKLMELVSKEPANGLIH